MSILSKINNYTEPSHLQGTTTAAPRTTATSNTEGRIIVDAVNKVFLQQLNKHPFVSLLTAIGKVYDGKSWNGSSLMKSSTGNYEFKCFEDTYNGRYCKVSGTYVATVGVTITVTGAGTQPAYLFTIGDIIMNARTGERMEVATIASATTITVVTAGRSLGSTAALAGADGDGLYIIGNASEENATARNVNTTYIANRTNYTQIFRTTIAVSGTEKEADLYTGPDLPYLRQKHAEQHALDKLLSTIAETL